MSEMTYTKHYPERQAHEQEVEMRMLGLLHAWGGFPRLLNAGEGWIEMSWCGQQPDQALKRGSTNTRIIGLQLAGLLSVLNLHGIRHRDISKHNMLWHPTQGLHLIDFGMAIGPQDENTPPVNYPDQGWFFCDLTDADRACIAMHELGTGTDISNDREAVQKLLEGILV